MISATVSVQGGTGYRLPTEAEWEYACRGGTTTFFSFGEGITPEQANYLVSLDVTPRPLPVGSYAPNAFNLYDMHGNIAEWCEDWFDSSSYKTRSKLTADPIVRQASPGEPSRVLRGGSNGFTLNFCRSAQRGALSPTHGMFHTGFRVARSK